MVQKNKNTKKKKTKATKVKSQSKKVKCVNNNVCGSEKCPLTKHPSPNCSWLYRNYKKLVSFLIG